MKIFPRKHISLKSTQLEMEALPMDKAHLGYLLNNQSAETKDLYSENYELVGSVEERLAYIEQYRKLNPHHNVIVLTSAENFAFDMHVIVKHMQRVYTDLVAIAGVKFTDLESSHRNVIFILHQEVINYEDSSFAHFLRVKRAAGFTLFLGRDRQQVSYVAPDLNVPRRQYLVNLTNYCSIHIQKVKEGKVFISL